METLLLPIDEVARVIGDVAVLTVRADVGVGVVGVHPVGVVEHEIALVRR